MKKLKDYEITDVTKLVTLTAIRTKVGYIGRRYIHLEDQYTDDAVAHITGEERHSGGGRITFGYVVKDGGYTYYFTERNGDYISVSKSDFITEIWDFIKRNYQ